MKYSGLKFVKLEHFNDYSILITDTEDRIQINSGDSYINCEFLCDSRFAYTEFQYCKFISKNCDFYFCKINDSEITSTICEIIQSEIGWCNLTSSKLELNRSYILYGTVKSEDTVINKTTCNTISFLYKNRNKFSLSYSTFNNCTANSNKLLSVCCNDLYAYTDSKSIWVGCQAFNIKLVRKYINDEDKVNNLASKLKIENFYKYIKAVKFLLDLE